MRVTASLGEAGGRETSRRAVARSMLTVVQIALSLAMLVGALLLTRTIRNLNAVDFGMDPSPIVTFGVFANPVGYSDAEAKTRMRRLYDELVAVPGVDGVAMDMYGPFWGGRFIGGLQPDDGGDPVRVTQRFASPGYFEALGIRLTGGRAFRAEDWNPAGTADVILTRALARRLFGESDPVGRTVTTASRSSPERYTVIGVTADLALESASGEHDLAMWRSIEALPLPVVTVMVRTDAAGPRLAAALRQAVFSVMPEVPIDDPVPLTEIIDRRIGEQRLFARLLGVLSGLAVLLAVIGLYGVIAWMVSERTREIGIRMALGARVHGVAKLVLGRVAILVAPGIALGLGGAVVIARLVESQLFGVEPLDPATYLAAAALFSLVALAACLAPTRAATRVDPAQALRRD
jgi:predicted permease